jgi:osmotically inducible protein OsmC
MRSSDHQTRKALIMSHLYTTIVNAYGGRSGTIKSEDGILD